MAVMLWSKLLGESITDVHLISTSFKKKETKKKEYFFIFYGRKPSEVISISLEINYIYPSYYLQKLHYLIYSDLCRSINTTCLTMSYFMGEAQGDC